jgi:hypothetical protein
MKDNKTIRQRFKSSVRRGTGEAYLIMQSNPTVDFSADIIKASLNNFAYDQQSEGSRALYLSELISLSKQQDKIRKAIFIGLATEKQDTWALVQLFDLAAIFAKQGDKKARQAIYNRFYKSPIQHSEWAGQDAIIEIDGIEGLKYVAKIKGKIIMNDPEEWEGSWLVDYFQEQNPKIKVYQELQSASNSNKYIKVYLEAIKKHKLEMEKIELPKSNYQTIAERISSKAIVPITPLGVKQISKGDIKKIASDFLKETDRLKLEKYMRIFDRVKYPYDYKPILALAKSQNKKTDRLVEFAAGALKYFSGSDIRKFAVETLNRTKQPSDYLDLLVSNYKKGDSKLLTTIVKNCKTENDVHSLIYGYVNIYKANKTKECKEPLETVYSKLTCGIHRTDIIKILIDNKVLSKQIREEIKYDSSEDTRKIAATLQKILQLQQ